MPSRKLALIGAGSKAQSVLARAATAKIMRKGLDGVVLPDDLELSVHVFEPVVAGSTWLNGQGFTDGRQTLCTSPLRDVTFTGGPFKLDELAPPLDPSQDRAFMRELRSRFSFQAYLDSGARGDAIGYSGWIDADMPPVQHEVFGQYLEWVCSESLRILESDGSYFPLSVEQLIRDGDSWFVLCNDDVRYGPYDGLITSGVGKAVVRNKDFKLRRLDVAGVDKGPVALGDVPSHNGQRQFINLTEYWSDRDQTIKRLVETIGDDGGSARISLIGDGGAAMAVAMDLIGSDLDCDVKVIGRRPAPEYRVRNIFADRYYGNDELWSALSIAERNDFASYYGSGSVWFENVESLQKSQRVEHLGREAKMIAFWGAQVAITLSRSEVPFYSDLVVDCRGYDPRASFIELLGGDTSSLGRAVSGIIGVHLHPFVYETVVNFANSDPTGFMDKKTFEFVLETLSGTLFDCCFSSSFEVRNPWRCLGEDLLAYADRFTPDLSVEAAQKLISNTRDALRGICGESEFPEGLHAPNFASIKGPAASNLMALGWIGRHITAKYGLI